MRHFLFIDNATGEDFLVSADSKVEAKEIAHDYFEEPKYRFEVSEETAEMSGLDRY
jgi:hypothetical protein